MSLLKKIGKKAVIPLVMLMILEGEVYANNFKDKIKNIYLTSCVNGEICSSEPNDVRLEDKVNLNLVLRFENKNGNDVYFSNSNKVRINGEKLNANDINKWNSEDISIEWFKVESKENIYMNSSPDKKHFSWDTPTYKEILVNKGSKWVISADAHPTNSLDDFNGGLGTMRYKVKIDYHGKKMSTPGKESTNLKGIKERVHRISFRKDDSFVGWLTSYFNLPYIFGSAGNPIENHQTEKYIGADCADLIVGAYRRMGHDVPYTCAAGLAKYSNTVVKEKNLLTDGENFYKGNKLLKFGKDIKEGDLILFGNWHVGVIVEDKSSLFSPTHGNPDGIFNKYDEMIHANYDVPRRAHVGGYGPFSILRLKEEKNEK